MNFKVNMFFTFMCDEIVIKQTFCPKMAKIVPKIENVSPKINNA